MDAGLAAFVQPSCAADAYAVLGVPVEPDEVTGVDWAAAAVTRHQLVGNGWHFLTPSMWRALAPVRYTRSIRRAPPVPVPGAAIRLALRSRPGRSVLPRASPTGNPRRPPQQG